MEQRISHAVQGSGTALGLSALAAVAVHAGLLFGWNANPAGAAVSPVVCNCVDVTLVDAGNAPAEESAAELPDAVPPPTAAVPTVPSSVDPLRVDSAPTEPPPSEPVPREPEVVAPVQPQAAASQVAKVASPPSPALTQLPSVREPLKPAKTITRSGTGAPGASGPVAGGSSGGVASNTLGKPVYLLRPVVNYPAESRASGEQGVVVLRITVNAGGRPVAVSVGVSSGSSRLDRAAVEGGWRCRVSNAFEGAQFEAPLRFSLKD